MRKKENAQDYRYFPDPDLLAVEVSRDVVEEIRKELPVLPQQRMENYLGLGLSEYEAEIITKDQKLFEFFDEAYGYCKDAKSVSNWLLGEISSLAKEDGQIRISPRDMAKIISFMDAGQVNRTVAKTIFTKVWLGEGEVENLAKTLGGKLSDAELEALVTNIIENNPKAVADFKNGPEPNKILKWFVGQVMKESRGKANAVLAEQIIKSKLN
jgi:aspartyl-tRNA(Asn)/glutamyl-tRNA(Gln) amidotransferase subunit B